MTDEKTTTKKVEPTRICIKCKSALREGELAKFCFVCETSQLQNYDYDDWLSMACDSGIDWDNNPPPQEMLTEELYIAYLQDAPWGLKKIPEKMRTAELCFAAVRDDDEALQFVPENLRQEVKARKDAITEDEWLDELSTYVDCRYIKLTEKLLTADFCLRMVELNGKTIGLVPAKLRTPELEAIAEQDDGDKWFRNIIARMEGDVEEPSENSQEEVEG